jgi:ABC-type transport system involved in multi-copper enzyme maturation permease subunit
MRLTGPILDKELRVLSRRPAMYVVRAAYLAILAVPAAMAWFIWVRPVADTVKTSEMAEVAEWVSARIITCQFIAAQVMALVLVAGALYEETRKGTLAVLFSSGITSSQVVLGKVIGRLLPAVLAVALALPLLALMRFWGGVPGDYVVAASCVTLTSALAVAALTFFLSLSGAAPHRIVVAGMIVVVAYNLATSILSQVNSGLIGAVAGLANPFTVIVALGQAAFNGIRLPFPWTLHCGLMLGFAAVVLGVTTLLLRRAAGMERSGDVAILSGMIQLLFRAGSRRAAESTGSGVARAVTGSAVLWKDGRDVARGRLVLHAGLGVLAVLTLLVVLDLDPWRDYWIAGLDRTAGWLVPSIVAAIQSPIFSSLLVGWWAILSVYTASLAAASIAQEREARSWPVLLSTPLTRRRIMWDKAQAIALRTLAGWLVYLICVVAVQRVSNGMLPARYFIPLVIMTALNPPIYAMFLIGTGLYIGLRSRTAFSAVLMTLAVIFAFHFVRQQALIPLVQMVSRLQVVPWLGYQGINLAVEAVVGVVMWLLAARSLRRRIFGGSER